MGEELSNFLKDEICKCADMSSRQSMQAEGHKIIPDPTKRTARSGLSNTTRDELVQELRIEL